MELGDGHVMKNGTIRYDTSSILLANDYQQLCLHAGYSANLYLKYAKLLPNCYVFMFKNAVRNRF